MHAYHSQFRCLVTCPAESKPNSKMTRTKTIDAMLMASVTGKKSLTPRGRSEHRARDLRRQTRRKCRNRSREQSDLSSHYFLKRSKIDISDNARFPSGYFDCSRYDHEGMPTLRFVMRHIRVIRGGPFLGKAG
jgi:hypothetical protein